MKTQYFIFSEKLKKFQITLNPCLCFFLIILHSSVLAKALFYIQPENVYEFIELEKLFLEDELLRKVFLYNFYPVLLFTLLIFFVFANFSLSVTISSFVFVIFAFINRYKIFLRQDPLVPTDLSLAKEMFKIIDNMDISTIRNAIFAGCVILLIGFLSSFFVRTRKMNLAIKLSAIIAIVTASHFANIEIYSNTVLYSKFPVNGNEYFLVNQYNSRGFIYCFLVQNNLFEVQIPEDYNPNVVEEYITEIEHIDTNKIEDLTPHIFMIMGEAFTDISEHSKINFDGFIDPLENFKNMKTDGLSGYIFTPNIGGGTADTEFDVLTGISTRELQLKPYSYRFVNSDMNAIPSWLREIGYNTVAVHPGNDWFYNRIHVYPYLGFDEMIFDTAFNEEFGEKYGEVTIVGGYINEKSTYDMIIDRFENLQETYPNEPTFNFCVTIESHGPYNWKYPDIQPNFNSEIPLSEEYTTALSNYFQSIHVMDTQLKRLADYIENLDEPAIILYFGDHMAGLPTEIFDELEYDLDDDGTFMQRTFLYKTPYLIWQNSAYKNEMDIVEYAKELEFPENDYHINTSYLGTAFMKLIGFENTFINHSNETRKFYPLTTIFEYVDPEDNEYKISEGPLEHSEYVTKYLELQYHELFK